VNEPKTQQVHATAVAIGSSGILITGSTGSGKSDLALRLIDRGAVLISDDQVILSKPSNAIILSAPTNIAGKMEVHSLGIIDVPHKDDLPLKLKVILNAEPERFPMDAQSETILGSVTPVIHVNATEASAAIKVELALKKAIA